MLESVSCGRKIFHVSETKPTTLNCARVSLHIHTCTFHSSSNHFLLP